MNKKKKSTNISPYPDDVIDRLARAFYPAILACWNSEVGQREFAAWQAEQAHHAPSKEKQSVPDGERPVVHIAVVCGFNRKFFKQCNSQQLVCDMQFTVVANESNRELRWQGASYSGTHPVFVFMETHAVPYATSGSFPQTPSAAVSYKTRPANSARTSQLCVPSELSHLPSSSSFNTSCPAQTSGNQ